MSKSQKRLNIPNKLWLRPGYDFLNFYLLHADVLRWYHKSQKRNLVLVETTLFSIGEESMLP